MGLTHRTACSVVPRIGDVVGQVVQVDLRMNMPYMETAKQLLNIQGCPKAMLSSVQTAELTLDGPLPWYIVALVS